jgi:DNA polymerase III sliding clamp (beta) subunit (PCNA family)
MLDVADEIAPVIMQKKIANAITVFPEEGNINVRTTRKSVIIDNGSIQLISRIIDSKFPDVSQFWVNEFLENKYMVVSKQEIKETINLIRSFSTNEFDCAKISVSDNEITFLSENGDKSNMAEHSITGENFNTEKLFVSLNINFLEKINGIIDTDEYNIHIKAPDKGVFITEANKSLNKSFIVQPVRTL